MRPAVGPGLAEWHGFARRPTTPPTPSRNGTLGAVSRPTQYRCISPFRIRLVAVPRLAGVGFRGRKSGRRTQCPLCRCASRSPWRPRPRSRANGAPPARAFLTGHMPSDPAGPGSRSPARVALPRVHHGNSGRPCARVLNPPRPAGTGWASPCTKPERQTPGSRKPEPVVPLPRRRRDARNGFAQAWRLLPRPPCVPSRAAVPGTSAEAAAPRGTRKPDGRGGPGAALPMGGRWKRAFSRGCCGTPSRTQ